MPRRRRWTPVRGTRSRVYDLRERILLGLADLPGHLVFGLARLARPARVAPDPDAVRDVLVLRLDRIGDVLMSLPALEQLRAALPRARIRLAVGSWSEEVARRAAVDELLIWSAPWVGRAAEGAETFAALARRARDLRGDRIDLALDLQGDVRAVVLMWLTGARDRVGYANTGAGYLLHGVVPLDETVSWVEQNQRAVAVALGRPAGPPEPVQFRDPDRLGFARRLYERLGLDARRPLVGVHPSGGRAIKQWPSAEWARVAARLQREFGATILITGSAADTPLARDIAEALPARPYDLTGRLSVSESLAVIAGLDLFLSPDTGPMHMACAVDTPSVSVFGPSDPVRYFSGTRPRHAVVRAELWCAPCNLIRRPPAECAVPGGPECLRLVEWEVVYREAARLLRDVGGYAAAGTEPSR